MKYDLVLKNCNIITMDDEGTTLKNHNIAIKNGRIAKITDSSVEGREVVNCCGGVVMPGFVNAHTHVAMTYMRGYADDLPLKEWLENYIWPLEARIVTRDNVKWGALLGIAEMLSFGITLFSDMYFFEDAVAEAVKEAGIRALLGEGILDFPTPSFKTPDEILNFTKTLYENYMDDELVKVSVAPHSPYTCSEDTLRKAKELANTLGLKYHIHLSETKDEMERILRERGRTPVGYLDSIEVLDRNSILVHMVWVEDGDIETVKDRGALVVPCPESHGKLGSGIAPVYEYLSKGIKVGIGTDGVSSNNDMDVLSDARFLAYIQRARHLNPAICKSYDILKIATRNGYEILGFDNSGVVKEGYNADLVIFDTSRVSSFPYYDLHSLVLYSMTGREVMATIVNGRVLYYRGEYRTIDVERVKYEVKRRIEKI